MIPVSVLHHHYQYFLVTIFVGSFLFSGLAYGDQLPFPYVSDELPWAYSGFIVIIALKTWLIFQELCGKQLKSLLKAFIASFLTSLVSNLLQFPMTFLIYAFLTLLWQWVLSDALPRPENPVYGFPLFWKYLIQVYSGYVSQPQALLTVIFLLGGIFVAGMVVNFLCNVFFQYLTLQWLFRNCKSMHAKWIAFKVTLIAQILVILIWLWALMH